MQKRLNPLLSTKNSSDTQPISDDRDHSKEFVLIVEPNPDHQVRTARMLALEGCRVVGTSSPDGARALLAEFPVSLVLISDNLPKMAGLAMAEELKENHGGLRVVVMTTEQDRQSELDQERSNMVEFLAKPFRIEALTKLLSDVEPVVA